MLDKKTIDFVIAALQASGGVTGTGTTSLLLSMFKDEDPELLKKATILATQESKFKVSLAAIADKLAALKPKTAADHPSPEEAWALLPKSEAETGYLTEEMIDAIYRAGVNDYLSREDFIGAERAFKTLYAENLSKSRAANRKPKWQASLGHDKSIRVSGLEMAVQRGILTADEAIRHDFENEAIYLSAEREHIRRLPEAQRKQLNGRVEHLTEQLKLLAESAKPESSSHEVLHEPCPIRMKDPYVIEKAKSSGLTPYEYLVVPAPPHVAAKVHAQLSKQFNIDLRTLMRKK